MKAIEKVYQMCMFDFERAVYSALTNGSLSSYDPVYYIENCYYFFMSDCSMAYGPKKDNLDLFLELSSSYPYLMTSTIFFMCIAKMFEFIDSHGSEWENVRKDYYIRWNSSLCEFGFLSDHWTLKYRG